MGKILLIMKKWYYSYFKNREEVCNFLNNLYNEGVMPDEIKIDGWDAYITVYYFSKVEFNRKYT